MKQERLLEITSTISKLDGPLVVLGYLTSLKESDMYLFFNCVKGSKYGSLNFYKAIKMFSDDYVRGKEVIVENSSLKEFGYNPLAEEQYNAGSNFKNHYLYSYTLMDDSFKIEGSRKMK